MFSLSSHKSPTARADTLAIKAALSEILSPENGAEYWRTLGELLTGKITRDEWSDATRGILSAEAGALMLLVCSKHVDRRRAARLHNQLILAILYNTTRPSVAPPATFRHAGWHKRKREGEDAASQLALSLDPREAKRRRIKELVHSLGKRERKRIKSLALLGHPVQQTDLLQRTFGPHDSQPSSIAHIANKAALTGGACALCRLSSSYRGLLTELRRCQSAQLCHEMQALPSFDILKDRMSCGAYTAALSGGVDRSAAVLLSQALEVRPRRHIWPCPAEPALRSTSSAC
jgi:hypothetical protein